MLRAPQKKNIICSLDFLSLYNVLMLSHGFLSRRLYFRGLAQKTSLRSLSHGKISIIITKTIISWLLQGTQQKGITQIRIARLYFCNFFAVAVLLWKTCIFISFANSYYRNSLCSFYRAKKKITSNFNTFHYGKIVFQSACKYRVYLKFYFF